MRLGLFFTYDISLRLWCETGLFDREIVPYRRIAENGIGVTFFTYGDSRDRDFGETIAPITVVPLYAGRRASRHPLIRLFSSLLLPVRYRREIQAVDLIKTNQMFGSWVAVLCKFLYKKKLVVRCGYEYYRFAVSGRKPLLRRLVWYWLSRIAYGAADGVILTSQEDREFVQRMFHVQDRKIRVLRNYIDTDRFRPLQVQKINRGVLFIGRLEEQKNLFSLLEAVRTTEFGLDIIGEGSLRGRIERYVRDHHVAARLLGLFPNKELPEIINRYPVYVLPSHYEGSPKALLEAMSCGLAVIGTEVVGIREVIRHGNNGYLCGTDAESIRKALHEVFRDEMLRKKMGERAREYVVDNYGLEGIVQQEVDFCLQLTG